MSQLALGLCCQLWELSSERSGSGRRARLSTSFPKGISGFYTVPQASPPWLLSLQHRVTAPTPHLHLVAMPWLRNEGGRERASVGSCRGKRPRGPPFRYSSHSSLDPFLLLCMSFLAGHSFIVWTLLLLSQLFTFTHPGLNSLPA